MCGARGRNGRVSGLNKYFISLHSKSFCDFSHTQPCFIAALRRAKDERLGVLGGMIFKRSGSFAKGSVPKPNTKPLSNNFDLKRTSRKLTNHSQQHLSHCVVRVRFHTAETRGWYSNLQPFFMRAHDASFIPSVFGLKTILELYGLLLSLRFF